MCDVRVLGGGIPENETAVKLKEVVKLEKASKRAKLERNSAKTRKIEMMQSLQTSFPFLNFKTDSPN